MTIGSVIDRPDLPHQGSASVHVSPAFRTIQSGYPSRTRANAAASDRFGEPSARPLFVSLPVELLTYTTRVSLDGVNTVQPSVPTVRPGYSVVPTRLPGFVAVP